MCANYKGGFNLDHRLDVGAATVEALRVLHFLVYLVLVSTIQAASTVRSLPEANVSGHVCGHAAASAIHLSSS